LFYDLRSYMHASKLSLMSMNIKMNIITGHKGYVATYIMANTQYTVTATL